MNVLVLGEMTFESKQMVKQLIEDGHTLRFQNIGQGTDATMQIDSTENDWSIRGVTVYPHRHIGGNQMTLQMAAKQLQTKKMSKTKEKDNNG